MNNNFYEIKSNLDLEKVSIAALKKVFSISLFPRIIYNIENPIFLKKIKKKADFQCFLCQNIKIFAKNVHFLDFDLGLFFFKKNKKLYVKIIDGNGIVAGKSVTNIFDYVFNLSENDFLKFKNEINALYKSVSKSKLLREEF